MDSRISIWDYSDGAGRSAPACARSSSAVAQSEETTQLRECGVGSVVVNDVAGLLERRR